MDELKCKCGFEAKSKAGLVSHQKTCLNHNATLPTEKAVTSVVRPEVILNVLGKRIAK